ncbi:MAG: DUF4956 domain-containing protein [Gemmatimonadales bacterium]
MTAPQAEQPGLQAPPDGVVRRLTNRFAYPAEHPFSSLTGYYLLLVAAGALVVWLVPGAAAMISGERLAQLMSGTNLLDTASGAPGSALSWATTLDMALAMIGSFLLMLPTSWVFMAERRRKGFDQALVQTMIVLSVAIAGVVVIVRNSVALAFSLTGIVAAVRFRTNLSDTRDTLYIFTAIGVGLAAGVQALAAALVLSMVFNYVILAFWRGNYGMCELGQPSSHLLIGATALPAGEGGGKKKKKKDFDSVLVVRADHTQQARGAVDALLAAEVSRFKLVEIEQGSKGRGHLKYLVRLGKKTDPRDLEDALLERGAPYLVGARVH